MIAGEPDTVDPDEDYVAGSGIGWSDRTNKWKQTHGDTVLEPTGFLCQAGMQKYSPILLSLNNSSLSLS